MNSLYRGISLAAVFWTTVSMSAYTPHETGSRTTASGARAKEGYTCAANFGAGPNESKIQPACRYFYGIP